MPPLRVWRSGRCAPLPICMAFPWHRPLGRAASLIPTSCEAFLASFKVWNSATVGGNICMSLPAGPMITLTVALEATYTLVGARRLRAHRRRSRLRHRQPRERARPGEMLRSIDIPSRALAQAPRPPPLHADPHGPLDDLHDRHPDPDTDDLLLTITAGTTHPVRLGFDTMPDAGDAARAPSTRSPDDVWFDDPNGTPGHRQPPGQALRRGDPHRTQQREAGA